VIGLLGLDYNVIYISLNGPPNEVPKNGEHTPLVCSPRVLEPERHGDIAVRPKWGDERGRGLVKLFHHNLVVARISIKEGEDFASCGRINYMIYAW
jgi:hypothetical protein